MSGPSSPQAPWRVVADGVEVAVRLTPRAAKPALGGCLTEADGGVRLVARVTAPPEDGKANVALLALLAKALRVPASACELTVGAGSRRKRVRVRGDGDELECRLADLAPAASGG